MTLDEYLAARFGPVFDALNDAGFETDEIAKLLKRGVIWQLLEAAPRNHDKWFSLTMGFCPAHPVYSKTHVYRRHHSDWIENTPEALFPHVSHLIQQEAIA